MTSIESSADGEGNNLHTKVRQLYAFLKEANQLQFRPVRRLSDQPYAIRISDMPKHPSAQLYRPIKTGTTVEIPDVLLKISRPDLTPCPRPHAVFADWLLPRWDDPYLEAEVMPSMNRQEIKIDEEGGETEETKTIGFEDDGVRVAEYLTWKTERQKWVGPELLARAAMKFFEDFYTLYAKLEKEKERLELLVADGIFSWLAESAIEGTVRIRHPILFKRVEIQFNPKIPEFTIHETDRESELYTSLFLDLKAVESSSIRKRQDELGNSAYHPLGWEDTSAFLKSLALSVSPTQGEYLEEPADGENGFPRIWRDPVLLLRNRTGSIATAVDKIIDHIDTQPVFPPALTQITGEEDSWVASGLSVDANLVSTSSGSDSPSTGSAPAKDILLVNEANEEQLEIVKRLDRSGSVVVQGPPGTGKTHTISNLIGHLLSQGKSILVTAHTVKALRVLRDKVPDMLKPLCVSVLGSDQLARRQLESAVSSITERLTSETSDSLVKKSLRYESERLQLVGKQLSLKHLLRESIENEYKPIDVGGKCHTPSDAARHVSRNRLGNDWIPSPIDTNYEIAGRASDIERLYALGAAFTANEEHDARQKIPEISDLPTESRFALMVSDGDELARQDISFGKERWINQVESSERLTAILEKLHVEFNDELLAQTWRPYAIVAGIQGAAAQEIWMTLTSRIESAVDAGMKFTLVMQHKPALTADLGLHKIRDLLDEIIPYLAEGKTLGFPRLLIRRDWNALIEGSSVSSGKPSRLEHFEAMRALAELQIWRHDLAELWDATIGRRTGNTFGTLGDAPEQVCRSLLPEIERCLKWNEKVWKPIVSALADEGLQIEELLLALPREATEISEYSAIERFAKAQLLKLLTTEISRRKLREIDADFVKLKNLISAVDPTQHDVGCVAGLIKAVTRRDVKDYESALAYLRRIHAVKPLVVERDRLLLWLKSIAPAWETVVRQRIPPHENGRLPNKLDQAWLWRQLNDVLEQRAKLDPQAIQQELDSVGAMLREVTRLLVDAKAWAEQLKRLQAENSMRQALVGWLDTAKRLASTRQLDKRNSLLIESRKLMRKCADAVPVWIMPISMVAESFDPQSTKFDVVIIDEASQADINALIPLYMGRQIIVVGDHEQVTPLGVGKDQTMLENLRKSMLKDIPNAHLYDNMSSIYDLARQSFGEGVRLVEHFRCVPQIISFSNTLSYEGKIRPLREADSSNLKPACVPYRVNGIREGDKNPIEAQQIVALIKAMIQHDAYKGKTIGVISMLGESQAILIQSLIHKEIPSVEIEDRRIQAGISGEFQGDERDVIFLSMVDSAADTNPLRATGDGAFEQTKKRYNVAVSRARDQLWVVHSFDPDLHLKATDLRYRLLQHVRDPDSSLRNFDEEVARTESPFEREVLKRLTGAGFRVRTQIQVGFFRIDMVVEGEGKRLAVECDGDRYHPIEKLAEDMNRQAILERLGWKFARIRGSAFYRDADAAMEAVFRRLEELEISPGTNSENENVVQNGTLIEELKALFAVDVDRRESTDARRHEGENDLVNVDPTASTEKDPTSDRLEQVTPLPASLGDTSEVDRQPKTSAPMNQSMSIRSSSLARGALYSHFSGPSCADPRVATSSAVNVGVLNIVKVEGPIQVKRCFDIYLRSCGIKRMGHELRDTSGRGSI